MNIGPSSQSPKPPEDGRASRRIVLIVVMTLASLCGLYMGTLSICILAGLKPDERVFLQFVAAGTYVLGVLSGILVNPHTGPMASLDPDPGKTASEPSQPAGLSKTPSNP